MKEKNVPIITILLIIAVCASIGYFMIFKSGLNFKNSVSEMKQSKWKINIKVNDEDLNDNTSEITTNNTEIKLKGKINKDTEIKYVLSVENKGTIDANYYTIVNSNNDLDIKLLDGDEDLKVGTLIKSKESKKIELVIKSNKDETLDFESDLKLVFNQNDN